MEALMLDVKNYEAFRELIQGSMLSAAEGKSSERQSRAEIQNGSL